MWHELFAYAKGLLTLLNFETCILPFSHQLFRKIAYICVSHDKTFHALFQRPPFLCQKFCTHPGSPYIYLPIFSHLPYFILFSLSLFWIVLGICPSFRIGWKPTDASCEHIPGLCGSIKEFRKSQSWCMTVHFPHGLYVYLCDKQYLIV